VDIDTAVGWIGFTILVSSIIPIGIFIYRYTMFSPWRLTVLGRSLLYQKIVLFLILLLSLIPVVFGYFSGLLELRLIVYAAVLFTFWNDLYQLLKIQRQYKHPRGKRQRI